MYFARSSNVIAVRLEKGEAVHESLLNIFGQVGARAGFVVSGIGMLQDPELGFFAGQGRYERRQFNGNFELLNLSGNVSLNDGEPMAHLHAMLANDDYSVFGGHLFSATVGLTLEVQLSLAEEAHMYRKVEPETGLPGLYISQL
jgi:predicted DNA-binding protein with PD1-like motif